MFGLSDKVLLKIKDVLFSFPEIEEVTLFGSRAMGNYKPGSDIDLALKGANITLNTLLRLNHKLEELPTLYKFDLINYNTITTPELKTHIDTFGKKIE